MRRVAIITGVTVILCLFLTWHWGPTSDVLGGLTFGWVAYLVRVLPKVTIAWDGVATGIVCLALFSFGLNRTLRWLFGEVQNARGAVVEGRRSWSAWWTASLVALIVVMFAAGISATGVVHQAGWLIASRRSLIEERTVFRDDWGSSVNHLKQVGMASYGRVMDSDGPFSGEPRPDGKAIQSWLTKILPETGFVLGGAFRDDLPWNDPRNSAYFKGVVPLYLNPEVRVVRNSEGYALSHYAVNVHVLDKNGALRRVKRGDAANLILAGEVAEGFKPWGDPTNLRDPGLGVNKVPGGFGGPSGSGANFLFMDGSVRFLRDTTSREVLRRLSMPKEPER